MAQLPSKAVSVNHCIEHNFLTDSLKTHTFYVDRTRIIQVSANHASDAPRVRGEGFPTMNLMHARRIDVDRGTSERVADYCYGQEKLLLLLFRLQVWHPCWFDHTRGVLREVDRDHVARCLVVLLLQPPCSLHADPGHRQLQCPRKWIGVFKIFIGS